LIMNTCPKRMINGPCGGYRGTICEDENLKCVWIVAYYTALKRGSLDKMFSLKLDPGFRVRVYRPAAKRPRGIVERILFGKPSIIYEYTPRPHTSPSFLVEELREISSIYHGVDFVDSPGGYPIPSPLAYASIVKSIYKHLHVSIQITARNRDRNQIVSDILAASLSGLDAIVATTGDLQPDEKGVWDLDAPRIIYLARLVLDLGVDHMGRRVGTGGEGMVVAASVNINAEPLEPEILKARVKMDAGAEMFITQPLFDLERFETFMKALKERLEAHKEIPVAVGIIPVTSRKIAQFFEKKVGVRIPDKIYSELRREKIDREALLKANLDTIEDIASKVNHNAFYISAFGDQRLGVEIAKVVRQVIG